MANVLASLLAVASDAPETVARTIATLAGDLMDPVSGVTPAPLTITSREVLKAPVDDAVRKVAYIRDPKVLAELVRRESRVAVRSALFTNTATPPAALLELLTWANETDRLAQFDRDRAAKVLAALPFEELHQATRTVVERGGFVNYLFVNALVQTASTASDVKTLCTDTLLRGSWTAVADKALEGIYPLEAVVAHFGTEAFDKITQNINNVHPCNMAMFKRLTDLGLEGTALSMIQRGKLKPDDEVFNHINGKAAMPGPLWENYLWTSGQQHLTPLELSDEMLSQVPTGKAFTLAWNALSWGSRTRLLRQFVTRKEVPNEALLSLRDAFEKFTDDLGADTAEVIAQAVALCPNARFDIGRTTGLLRHEFLAGDLFPVPQRLDLLVQAGDDYLEMARKLVESHSGSFQGVREETVKALLERFSFSVEQTVRLVGTSSVRNSWVFGQFPLNQPTVEALIEVFKTVSVSQYVERGQGALSPTLLEAALVALCAEPNPPASTIQYLLRRPEVDDQALERLTAAHPGLVARLWFERQTRELTVQWRERLIPLFESPLAAAKAVCEMPGQTGPLTATEWAVVRTHLAELAPQRSIERLAVRQKFDDDEIEVVLVANPARLGRWARGDYEGLAYSAELLDRLYEKHREVLTDRPGTLCELADVIMTRPWGPELLLDLPELVSTARNYGPGSPVWLPVMRALWQLLHDGLGDDTRLWEQAANLLKSWPGNLRSLLLTARATRS